MDIGLLILRIALGVLIIGHGTQKAFGWFHGPGPTATAQLFEKWGFRPGRVLVGLAAATECLGGLLVIAGFATPLAAAMLIATMAAACAPNVTNSLWAVGGGYEVALLYGLMAVVVGFTGSGAYSVDHVLGLPHPQWAGPAALALGLLSTTPILLRRHWVLRRRVTV